MRRLSAVVGIALLGWLGAAVMLDIVGHRSTLAPPYDAIIVAGCRVDPGGVPSDCLAGRVDRAIALYQDGVAPRIVFTGGVGENPPSEGAVGAARAEAAGVPAHHLLIEDQSTSTEENARFASQQPHIENVVVVSDAWHTFRVGRVFGRYFPRVATVGVDSPWAYRAPGAMREVAAIAYYAMRGRLHTTQQGRSLRPPGQAHPDAAPQSSP